MSTNPTPDWPALMASTIYGQWNAVLKSCNCEAGLAAFNRMADPQPGDWVVETSTYLFAKRRPKPWDGFGVLVRVEGDRTRFDTHWIIRVPDGREVSWENCKFVARLPEEHEWFPSLKSEISTLKSGGAAAP